MASRLRSRTSCPLYIYCKIFFSLCASLYRFDLALSPYYIRLRSPPPVESRVTLGKAPLQRGAIPIHTRDIHKGEILLCFPRSWLIYFRTLLCRSNGSINYTARAAVRLYVSLGTRAEWRATNLFLSANKKPNYYSLVHQIMRRQESGLVNTIIANFQRQTGRMQPF